MTCFCAVTVQTTENSVVVRAPGPQGRDGRVAPNVLVRYSADGISWHESYMEGDEYFSLSTDGGTVWGGAVFFKGEPGEDGAPGQDGLPGEKGETGPAGPQGIPGANAPEVQILYSADGDLWNESYTAGDSFISISTDGGLTWSDAILFRGPQGLQGDTGPQGPQGIQGPAGPAGEDGVDGLDGADGRTILSGTVDPTTEGQDGDFYINVSTSKLFGPKNVSWPTGISLIGPKGDNGIGVPSISSGDSGKVLAVKSDESGTEWVDAPSGGGGVSLGMVIALGGD